ncbi:MAG: cytochrome c, partial [Acidobacteriota bacterium]
RSAISLGDLAARTTPNAARRALTSDTGRPAHPWRGVDQAAPAAAQAELEAVLTWLWAASDNAPTAVEELALAPSILRRGEIRRGARLFGDLGCRACHDLDAAPAAIDRSGPPLADLSMRRNARWLSAWLRAPERVHPGTTMPNFRLDDATTADLVAFLLDGEARLNPVPAADAPSPRGDEPDRIELGRTEPEPPAQLGASALTAARDDLLLRALEAEATLEAAAARFEALDGPERWRALGRLVVERRGCAGCHRLPTDDEPPIQPLDGGSLARFGETMPMPNGGLAAELDARHAEWIGGWNLDGSLSAALEIELASWRLPQGPTPDLDPEITAGAALVARHGCDACHAFDLDAPSAAPADRFPGGRPPSLALAGRRLRAPWTAAYLDDPARETTRPWLATRMPTFDLDDEKRDALVRLFTARADQPLLVTQPTASTLERSAGAVLYSTLQCVRCHVGRLDPGGTTIEPAPLYDRAPERLRPRFVLEWILDPHDVRPDTGMPRFFAAPDQTNGTHGGLDASFLATTFETPMFGVERARLRRLFATEAEYRRFVTDPHRVAAALRAHLLELPTARRTVEPAPAPLRPDQVVFPTAQSLGRPSS